jgi:hypothetical protein
VKKALRVSPGLGETELDRNDEGDAVRDEDSLTLEDADGGPVADDDGHGSRVREPVGIDGNAVLLLDSVTDVETETDGDTDDDSDEVCRADREADSDAIAEYVALTDSVNTVDVETVDDAVTDSLWELVALAEKLVESVIAVLGDVDGDELPLLLACALSDALKLAASDCETVEVEHGDELC